MATNRQPKRLEAAEHDSVVAALREAEMRYRATVEELTQQLADERSELRVERERAQHHREMNEALAGSLKQIHRSLFGGNIYELILKACLTLTGATRGLYVTTRGKHEPFQVRASIDVEPYPSAPPSDFIKDLCHVALENERVVPCNDPALLPEQPGKGEAFRNCVVAPVVLRSDLNGVVIVADKAGGDFDEDDADVLLSIGSQAAVAVQNTHLQREVQEAYLSIVNVLAETMAARNQHASPYHQLACRHARIVAAQLGLPEHDQSVTYYAALLHDVGNVGVSDGVLNKPGPLLDVERELIRAHAQIGHELLREIPLLEAVADVVRLHHERYDGSGYPDGLKADAIPIAARIVAVVAAFGAMLTPRSYRQPLTREAACEELRRNAGSQFDPLVVDAYLDVLNRTREADGTDEPSGVPLPGLDARREATNLVAS
jgi:hypothetical protein